jgi:O-antigen/teichoic acid export membrane protein
LSTDGESRRAGERAVRNTLFRAVAEVVGKFASLVLFAVLARQVSTATLGTFVFALAWGEVAMTPVGLGIDRYLLRRVAMDRAALDTMFFNALTLKLVRGIAMIGLSVLAAWLLGFDSDVALAVAIITLAVFAETLSRTHMTVFNALERADLAGRAIVVQRFAAAALGIGALLAGGGLIAVCAALAVAGLLRLGLSFALLARHVGMPARALPRAERKELTSRSLPFTAQDLFGLVLARADVLLLAALASDAVVGVYGSAYRLLDATAFVGASLSGAFSAMYTYLGHDTRPTVRAVFQRSVKLALIALVPIAVSYGVLAEPLCRALFGDALAAAAEPLRLLAPVVVLLGLVVLAGGVVVSRDNPTRILVVVIAAAAVNLGLNLALIPPLEANGAALAMLLSTLVYAAAAMTLAVRLVRGVSWAQMAVPPLAAGLAMAAVMAALAGVLPVALVAGAVVYVATYVAVERVVSPSDLDFALGLVRGRLRLTAIRESAR